MLKQTHRANITLPEIFEYVQMQETQELKVQALLTCRNSKQLKWFVNAMYNFDFHGFPIPDYKPNKSPVGIAQSINTHINRLESAVVMHQKGNMKRYEDIMAITLECISRDESLLLERLFLNKKVDGISKAMWKKVFPEFFRDEV
jgi:hypothetical protein